MMSAEEAREKAESWLNESNDPGLDVPTSQWCATMGLAYATLALSAPPSPTHVHIPGSTP